MTPLCSFFRNVDGPAGRLRLLTGLSAVATLVTGCMSPSGFAPAAYVPVANLPAVYGEVRPAGTKTVQILPVLDRLHPDSRALLAPGFSATAYFTGAMRQEMTALGIACTLMPASTNALGSEVSGALAPVPADVCRLETAARWLSPERVVIDVKLTTVTGQVLLEKRACTTLPADITTITHMVLRQILADPAFREAIR